MNRYEYSEHKLARTSKVGQKTINNILHGKTNVTLSIIERLAASFGLNVWQILMPGLPEELIGDVSMDRLIAAYIRSSEEGRDLIARVAEREAEHASSQN